MDTIRDVFAHNLREIRKSRRMTQNLFAEAIKIPLSTLQKYEAGTIPQDASLKELVAKLGLVTETQLFLDPDLVKEPTSKQALAVITKIIEGQK